MEELALSPASGEPIASGTASPFASANQMHQPNFPSSQGLPPALSRRSCTTCKKRKVRCDKLSPCSACRKAQFECIFPSSEPVPRRRRKQRDRELITRLQRLESVIERLSTGAGTDEKEEGSSGRESERGGGRLSPIDSHPETKVHNGWKGSGSAHGTESESGLLIQNGGRSRYVKSQLWATLGDEVRNIKGILDTSPELDDEFPDTTLPTANNDATFIFGPRSIDSNLRSFHPPLEDIFKLWQVYIENIDPIVKLFHTPTVQNSILEVCQDLDNIHTGMEAMMFAMYYSAVISLSPELCRTKLNQEKTTLLAKYRFAVEQALAKADFLNTNDIMVLQAFVLFLAAANRVDDSRYIWTLIGLVSRIAQSLGLHRDGTLFSLPPFETEMRRRLWWQICLLDGRAGESTGVENSVLTQQFDTKLPLNINDSDLDPKMSDPPVEHNGVTDMIFSLLRYEVGYGLRSLHGGPSPHSVWHKLGSNCLSSEEKLKFIDEFEARLQDKYLKHCNPEAPLDFVSITVARSIICRMRLFMQQPRQVSGDAKVGKDYAEKKFQLSIEILENAHVLLSSESTQKWRWNFQTFIPWHALSHILSELCIRTKGQAVDRAWAAVNAVCHDYYETVVESNKGLVWKPIRSLLAKARALRREALLQRHDPGSLSSDTSSVQELNVPTIDAAFVDISTAAPPAPDGYPYTDSSSQGAQFDLFQFGTFSVNPWPNPYDSEGLDVNMFIDPEIGKENGLDLSVWQSAGL